VTGQPRVTVGVANYNGRHLLEVVLASLRAQTYRDFRVVVVDDASGDDSVAWLRQHWPDVQVLVHERNRGVTAALGSCLRAGDSELAMLVNNDVELDRDCVAQLVGALDAHPEAGVACGKLIDYRRRELLDGAGDVYTWGGEAHRRGQGQRDIGQYDCPQEIFSACAGAALYRRTALAQVGGFDERLFANYEDVDWCFRAQLIGWRCRYVPAAIAYHMGSATLDGARAVDGLPEGTVNDFQLYQNWRNAIWVAAKNYPAAALVRHAPELAFVQLRNLAIALRRGRGGLWLRVWRDALAGMPAVLSERRRVQRSRTRSLADLNALIGADR
jgi:GT2 family glycosyltransferase